MLSETIGGGAMPKPVAAIFDEGPQRIWLRLCFPVLLLLGAERLAVPFAFVPLRHSVVDSKSPEDRRFTLAGKPEPPGLLACQLGSEVAILLAS